MNIKKDNFTKLTELLSSLQIIKDSLVLYEKGKDCQILPISGQLRALLIDKKSLLFELAKLTKTSTNIWYLPYDKNAYSQRGLAFTSHILELALEKTYPNHTEISLQNAIKLEIMEIDGIIPKDKKGNALTISSELLIKSYANKAGGAHYDAFLEPYIVAATQVAGKPVIDSLLLHIARIVLNFGLTIIQKMGGFDLQISLAVNPKQIIDVCGCIFEATLPNNPMGYTLYIDNLFKLHFLFLDSHNLYTEVVSTQTIDWTCPHVVNISAEITDELTTELSLYIDGHRFGKNVTPLPLLVLSEPSAYEEFFNMSKRFSCKPFEFGISNFLLYNKPLDVISKASNISLDLQKIKASKDSDCVTFSKDITSKRDIETTNMLFNKTPNWSWSLNKIARGEMPEVNIDS